MPRTAATVLAALLPLALPALAGASVSGTYSTVTVSADGSRLLVMRFPRPEHDYAPPFTLPGGRVVVIRDTFDQSGVYAARTLEPLWQVDWCEHDFNLLHSPDFRHVVRFNPQALGSDWALSFFDDGRLVKAYAASDLLTGLRTHGFFRFTPSGWHTVWYESLDLDPMRRQVHLSTARRTFPLPGGRRRLDLGLQEFYAFDLATGAVVSERVTGAWRPWAYGAVAIAILVTLLLALRMLWRALRRWRAAMDRRRGFAVVPDVGENPPALL